MQTSSGASHEIDLSLLVHAKEKLYFGIAVVLSIAIYAVLVATVLTSAQFAGVIIFYAIIFGLIYLIVQGLFIGHVRGNGIRVSPSQFPELMALADAHAGRLGMEETPAIFILQSGVSSTRLRRVSSGAISLCSSPTFSPWQPNKERKQ